MYHKSFLGSIFFKSTIICTLILSLAYVTNYAAPGQWKQAALHSQETGKQAILVRVVSQSENELKFEYNMPDASFKQLRYQKINGKITEFCEMGNAKTYSKPGEPRIPYIFSKFILPQGHTVENITLSSEERVTLEGKHLLSYGLTPLHTGSRQNVSTKPCAAIYGSNEVFPAKTHELVSIQHRCGVEIAYVKIFPVAYYPMSETVSYLKSFTLDVTTKKDVSAGTGVRTNIKRLQKRNKVQEENPSMLQNYTDGIIQGAYQHSLCNPRDEFSYVIVTNSTIINATTDTSINDLISLRESQGFTCKIQDIDEVYSNYTGSADSDKLRNFLKDAYNNWQTEFVLLGGDTRIIPKIEVYAEWGDETDDIPTDMPYQCLDQATWDDDYEAEIFIGRFSAETATEFGNQATKTIRYETVAEGDSYLKTGLGIGEKLSQSGATPPYTYAKPCMLALEQFFPTDFSFDGLYEADNQWSKSDLFDEINTEDYSILNHFGHSSRTFLMKMYTNDVSSFNNDKPVFLKSQGCLAGAFDGACIGEAYTTSSRVGMFAVILNSRFGWFYDDPDDVLLSSSHQVAEAFWSGISVDLEYFGELNEYSHSSCPDMIWDILETNLLGDPAVRFRGIDATVAITDENDVPFANINKAPAELGFSNARISYVISENNVPVELTLYNLNGKLIKTLVNKVQNAGTYIIDLTSKNIIAEGVYVCRLKTSLSQKTIKIINK